MLNDTHYKIRVLIADDEGLFRDALKMSLASYPQIEVAGTAANGFEAINLARQLSPDVILMDIEMGEEINGIEAARSIQEEKPNTGIIILSIHREKQYIQSLFSGKFQKCSYLLKQSVNDTAALIRAIENCHAGLVVLDPAIIGGLVPEKESRLKELTKRQVEVLQSIAAGDNNQTISEKLSISEKSVENYINVIYQQLGFESHDGIQPRVKAALFFLKETGALD